MTPNLAVNADVPTRGFVPGSRRGRRAGYI